MTDTKPTTAQLEALAFALATGWKPKRLHLDTSLFVSDNLKFGGVVPYDPTSTAPARFYHADLRDPAMMPLIETTKTWKTHATLLAAGFRLIRAEMRHGVKGASRAVYYRDEDQIEITSVFHSYTAVTGRNGKVAYGNVLDMEKVDLRVGAPAPLAPSNPWLN